MKLRLFIILNIKCRQILFGHYRCDLYWVQSPIVRSFQSIIGPKAFIQQMGVGEEKYETSRRRRIVCYLVLFPSPTKNLITLHQKGRHFLPFRIQKVLLCNGMEKSYLYSWQGVESNDIFALSNAPNTPMFRQKKGETNLSC